MSDKIIKTICLDCKKEREISYNQLWNIRKGISTGRCPKCKKGINMIGLEKGRGWNKGLTGEKSHSFGKPSGMLGKKSWNGGKKNVYTKETIEKMSKARIGRFGGENCPNWKDGITSENLIIRSSLENRLWRENVFARDNYICQKCKVKGGILRAHHIENFAQYPELRFIIENGITFCIECHRLFHRIYGIKNNNKEQIKEFLCQTNFVTTLSLVALTS